MKDFYYLLGLLIAFPLLLSSVGASEITPELCSEISEVIAEAVERGDIDKKQAGWILSNCIASAD